jgi:hypothetical protein
LKGYLVDDHQDVLVEKEIREHKSEVKHARNKSKRKELKKKGIIVDPDNKPLEEYKGMHLPRKVKKMFGCDNCEWINTFECPFKLKPGKHHEDFICIKRKNHLLSFMPEHIKKPTYPIWEAYYNHGMAQAQLNNDFMMYKQLAAKYQEKIDAGIEDDKLKQKVDEARYNWERMLKTKLKYNEKLLDRETPKKLEIEQKMVKPTDVGEMIDRAKELIIDAEVIEDDEKDNSEED